MAKFLLGKGAEINAKANDGTTALAAAQSAGDQAIVELLCSQEAWNE